MCRPSDTQFHFALPACWWLKHPGPDPHQVHNRVLLHAWCRSLFAMYLPLMEMMYRKAYCDAMMVEMQCVMEGATTALAFVGMAWDGGFSEIRNESSRVFGLGPRAYWLTVGYSFWARLDDLLHDVVDKRDLHDGADGHECVRLRPSGFCSYVYGIYVNQKKRNKKERAKCKIVNDTQQLQLMEIKRGQNAKYCGTTGSRPAEFAMEQNVKLSDLNGDLLSNPSSYRGWAFSIFMLQLERDYLKTLATKSRPWPPRHQITKTVGHQ
ncbi:hypothetical protein RJ639_010803, partial [Escallonia herrerae]